MQVNSGTNVALAVHLVCALLELWPSAPHTLAKYTAIRLIIRVKWLNYQHNCANDGLQTPNNLNGDYIVHNLFVYISCIVQLSVR
jgi:hypothetical protein